MNRAGVVLDPAFRVGGVDPRLWGSFVEHLGRCVYGGIYEPGHPSADAEGFRGDVVELTRELGVTTVRYPGGNFVSGYRWQDGVGPRSDRPTRLDLAWSSLEPNEVGVDEFIAWCRRAGVEPMMAINLGTRGIEDAVALVEYCNHPGGSYWSDMRVANGVSDPHGIRLWCLGNEMDGPWQIGRKSAREYGALAAAVGKAMRMVDPDITLIACGSSSRNMPTFAAWEAEVLEQAYDVVDYVSLHSYFRPTNDGHTDIASFLASGVEMDLMIEQVVATCDHVGAKIRNPKRIGLSFDEWNVWHSTRTWRSELQPWTVGPAIMQDNYTVADAVVVGSMLNSLLRHADRVTMACFAQLVNVIAPMTTEPGGGIWRQTTFYPMQLVFRHGRGMALQTALTSPSIHTEAYGTVPQLDCAATLDEETGGVTVFMVNRSPTQPMVVDLDLRSFANLAVVEHLTVTDDDPSAVNTADNSDRVVPKPASTPKVTNGHLSAQLDALSWNMVRLTFEGGPGTR